MKAAATAVHAELLAAIVATVNLDASDGAREPVVRVEEFGMGAGV